MGFWNFGTCGYEGVRAWGGASGFYGAPDLSLRLSHILDFSLGRAPRVLLYQTGRVVHLQQGYLPLLIQWSW